jgi:HSP20 family protein
MERLDDGAAAPALDLYVTSEAIVANVALPGMKPENVEIWVGDDLVTIDAASEEPMTEARHVHRELSHGPLRRSFWLPTAVQPEAATASLRDGLLTLVLPKADRAESRRVRVEIT